MKTGNLRYIKKVLLNVEIVILLADLILEIIITPIMAVNEPSILTAEWIFRWIGVSQICNFGLALIQVIMLRVFRYRPRLHPYIIVFTMTAICTVIASQHYVFPNTQTIFSVPIFLTVLLMDKKLNLITDLLGIAGLSIAIFFRNSSPDSRGNILPDSIISYIFIAVFAVLSYILIDFLIRQHKETMEAKREAEKANNAKSEFLSSMSHEIRSPINSILGMNEMILRESSDSSIREYASNIQTSGNVLLALISDILDISKIESGRIEIQNTEYELTSLINDSCSIVSGRIHKKSLDFTINCDETLPSSLIGDETRIRQIIVNFLTNAVKYTIKGGIILNIYGNSKNGLLNLDISVKDSGIGIKEENLKKMFRRFQRFDRELNRNIEGSGLGLRISKQLAELMKGTIEVKSVYGEGSEFILHIPQKIADPSPVGKIDFSYHSNLNAVSRIYKCSFSAPEARILIVDDIDTNLLVFENLLKDTKIQIDSVLNGEECIKKACLKKYDLIFIDHMMPYMDGIEVFSHIKNLDESVNKNTPAIIFTANAISGSKKKYMEAGFCDYLTKPVQSEKLEKTIIRHLPPEKVIVNDNSADMNANAATDKKQMPADFLQSSFRDFDYEKAMESCAGNEEILLKLISAYTENNFLERMEKDFLNEDWNDYTICAHSLKSSSRTIGLADLGDKAFRLEQAAKENRIEFIKASHPDIMRQYRDTMEKLSVLL